MTEKSYERAVQVLRNRIGARWNGVEAEGRDEMEDILEDELGYSDREAHDAIDAMIESGALRYNRGDAAGPPLVPPVPLGTGGTSGGAGAPLAAVPLAAAGVAGGYWQIGPGGDDTDTVGRKGQVSSGS